MKRKRSLEDLVENLSAIAPASGNYSFGWVIKHVELFGHIDLLFILWIATIYFLTNIGTKAQVIGGKHYKYIYSTIYPCPGTANTF